MARGYKRSYKGWYKLKHPEKYKKPLDNTMASTRDGCVQYKSSLELRAFKYCDLNPAIKHWSLEPFFILYTNPLDHKTHRYFPDLWIEFESLSFIVEVKSSSETQYPCVKNKRFAQALNTYLINTAKWQAALEFCKTQKAAKPVHFQILTEQVLK